MDENVLCAILGGDEPVALGARELLADTLEDGAGGGTRCPVGRKERRYLTGGTGERFAMKTWCSLGERTAPTRSTPGRWVR